MKKLFVLFSSLLIGVSVFANNPGEIEENIIRSFEKSFPRAQQVKWSETPTSWVVSFYANETLSRVIYTKDGTIIQLVRYYQKQQLPFYLYEKAGREYSGKEIYGVVEVSLLSNPGSYSNITYYITLEDSKYWTTVKADSHGNLSTVKKIRKAL